jgi:hypothetical protein
MKIESEVFLINLLKNRESILKAVVNIDKPLEEMQSEIAVDNSLIEIFKEKLSGTSLKSDSEFIEQIIAVDPSQAEHTKVIKAVLNNKEEIKSAIRAIEARVSRIEGDIEDFVEQVELSFVELNIADKEIHKVFNFDAKDDIDSLDYTQDKIDNLLKEVIENQDIFESVNYKLKDINQKYIKEESELTAMLVDITGSDTESIEKKAKIETRISKLKNKTAKNNIRLEYILKALDSNGKNIKYVYDKSSMQAKEKYSYATKNLVELESQVSLINLFKKTESAFKEVVNVNKSLEKMQKQNTIDKNLLVVFKEKLSGTSLKSDADFVTQITEINPSKTDYAMIVKTILSDNEEIKQIIDIFEEKISQTENNIKSFEILKELALEKNHRANKEMNKLTSFNAKDDIKHSEYTQDEIDNLLEKVIINQDVFESATHTLKTRKEKYSKEKDELNSMLSDLNDFDEESLRKKGIVEVEILKLKNKINNNDSRLKSTLKALNNNAKNIHYVYNKSSVKAQKKHSYVLGHESKRYKEMYGISEKITDYIASHIYSEPNNSLKKVLPIIEDIAQSYASKNTLETANHVKKLKKARNEMILESRAKGGKRLYLKKSTLTEKVKTLNEVISSIEKITQPKNQSYKIQAL